MTLDSVCGKTRDRGNAYRWFWILYIVQCVSFSTQNWRKNDVFYQIFFVWDDNYLHEYLLKENANSYNKCINYRAMLFKFSEARTVLKYKSVGVM